MTRDLLPDIVFLVAVAFATAVMLWLECGCAARPEAREPVRAETPFCFRLLFKFDGKEQAGLACGASERLCESARGRAMQWGAAAGIREAGQCRRDP